MRKARSGKCSGCPYRLAVLTGQEEVHKWFEVQKKTGCRRDRKGEGSGCVKDMEELVSGACKGEKEWGLVDKPGLNSEEREEEEEEREGEGEFDQGIKELQAQLHPLSLSSSIFSPDDGVEEHELELESVPAFSRSTLAREISDHTLKHLHLLSIALSPSLFSAEIKRVFDTFPLSSETPEERSARFDREIEILLQVLKDPDSVCCEDGKWFVWQEKKFEIEIGYESEDDDMLQRLSLRTPMGKEAVIADELAKVSETYKTMFDEDGGDEEKFRGFENAIARVLELMKEEEIGGGENIERVEVDERDEEAVVSEREGMVDIGF